MRKHLVYTLAEPAIAIIIQNYEQTCTVVLNNHVSFIRKNDLVFLIATKGCYSKEEWVCQASAMRGAGQAEPHTNTNTNGKKLQAHV